MTAGGWKWSFDGKWSSNNKFGTPKFVLVLMEIHVGRNQGGMRIKLSTSIGHFSQLLFNSESHAIVSYIGYSYIVPFIHISSAL